MNVTVIDPDEDDYSNPQLLLYKEEISDPIIDWTDMNRVDTNKPNWYYTFDPKDLKNEDYNIRVRANDSEGFGYNEIRIIIEINRLDESVESGTNFYYWLILGGGLAGLAEAIWIPLSNYFLNKEEPKVKKRTLIIWGIVLGIGAFTGGVILGYILF